MSFKPFWLPHLEFLAETNEGDVGGDPCVFAQAFGENGASVLVDREDLARAEQSSGELIFFVRVRGKALDEGVDLVDQTFAAGVERRRIEGGVAVDAIEAVLGEDCAEGSRDRNAAFGVDPIGESRHKLVHLPLTHPSRRGDCCQSLGCRPVPEELSGRSGAGPPVASKGSRPTSPTLYSPNGQSWDNMG